MITLTTKALAIDDEVYGALASQAAIDDITPSEAFTLGAHMWLASRRARLTASRDSASVAQDEPNDTGPIDLRT